MVDDLRGAVKPGSTDEKSNGNNENGDGRQMSIETESKTILNQLAVLFDRDVTDINLKEEDLSKMNEFLQNDEQNILWLCEVEGGFCVQDELHIQKLSYKSICYLMKARISLSDAPPLITINKMGTHFFDEFRNFLNEGVVNLLHLCTYSFNIPQSEYYEKKILVHQLDWKIAQVCALQGPRFRLVFPKNLLGRIDALDKVHSRFKDQLANDKVLSERAKYVQKLLMNDMFTCAGSWKNEIERFIGINSETHCFLNDVGERPLNDLLRICRERVDDLKSISKDVIVKLITRIRKHLPQVAADSTMVTDYFLEKDYASLHKKISRLLRELHRFGRILVELIKYLKMLQPDVDMFSSMDFGPKLEAQLKRLIYRVLYIKNSATIFNNDACAHYLLRALNNLVLEKLANGVDVKATLTSEDNELCDKKICYFIKFCRYYVGLYEKILDTVDEFDTCRQYRTDAPHFSPIHKFIKALFLLRKTLRLKNELVEIEKRKYFAYEKTFFYTTHFEKAKEKARLALQNLLAMQEETFDVRRAFLFTFHICALKFSKVYEKNNEIFEKKMVVCQRIVYKAAYENYLMNENFDTFSLFCTKYKNSLKYEEMAFRALSMNWLDRILTEVNVFYENLIPSLNREHYATMTYFTTDTVERLNNYTSLLDDLNTKKSMFDFIDSLEIETDKDRRKAVVERLNECDSILKRAKEDLVVKWESKLDMVMESLELPVLSLERIRPAKRLIVNSRHKFHEMVYEFTTMIALRMDEHFKNSDFNAFHRWMYEITRIENAAVAFVHLHEKVRSTISAHEYPLIAHGWARIHMFVLKASTIYTWTTKAIDKKLCRYYLRLSKLIQPLIIHNTILNHALQSLEKEARKSICGGSIMIGQNLLAGGAEAAISQRKCEIERHYSFIKKLMQEVEPMFSMGNDIHFNIYTTIVDCLITNIFMRCVFSSIAHIRDYIDDKHFSLGPCFTFNVSISPEEKVPQISIPNDGSLQEVFATIEELLDLSWQQASFFKYLTESMDDEERESDLAMLSVIGTTRNDILKNVFKTIKKGREIIQPFGSFWPFWSYSVIDYLNTISDDQAFDDNQCAFTTYVKRIEYFEELLNNISSIKDNTVIDRWLEIDTGEIRGHLMTCVNAWKEAFIERLEMFCTDGLEDLNIILVASSEKFDRDPANCNRDDLIDIILFIKEFDSLKSAIEERIKAINVILEFLSSRRSTFVNQMKSALEKLPGIWVNTKVQGALIRYKIAPYKSDEIARIKQDWEKIGDWQKEFYNTFHEYGPFHLGVLDAYEQLDSLEEAIKEKHEEIRELLERGQILELRLHELRQLKVVQSELQHLKQLWDINEEFDQSFEKWNKTLWKNAKLDDIEFVLKQKFLMHDLRALTKICGKWELYNSIEEKVKNMLVAIRVVGDLKHDSLRRRHWDELMMLSSVGFSNLSETMTLSEVLDLNLHLHEEEVTRIIEKANREAAAEKIIAEISSAWDKMEINTEIHESTSLEILAPDDELMETLDDHQNQLQILCNSKHLEYFEADLSQWQSTLSLVDQNLRKMIEVQKLWQHLETIFTRSKDIRDKLPKETGYFQLLDRLFRNVCAKNLENLKAVPCTTRDQLYETLDEIETGLNTSQKALESYLEGKRQKFPRFYFVSTPELLAILSNGLYPKKIMHLLIKLFDSIDKLDFDEKPSSFAIAVMKQSGPKWIVLDGDIDPMWIESLNTVMDDNKMLTLASNERIQLTSSMRLLFEISHLKSATPATVSRAGILFVSTADVGYRAMFESWLMSRSNVEEKTYMRLLFDQYVPPTLDILKSRFRKFTATVDTCHIQSLCHMLSSILSADQFQENPDENLYELVFVWVWIWASAGCLGHDQLGDERLTFSKWFISEFKVTKFVDADRTIFDYFVDLEQKQFVLWEEVLPAFTINSNLALYEQMVPTGETERINHWMRVLITKSVPVMLVGPAGTGKTLMVNKCLETMRNIDCTISYIPMHYYTSCETVQTLLERRLEKLSGRNYGPLGASRLIYFIDDFNMPQKDKYQTIQAHTIIRQHLDYGHWYDRQKLFSKEIKNCQYVTCMNQNMGNFSISSRLQRHFVTFAVSMPSKKSLNEMLTAILTSHFIEKNDQEQVFSNSYKAFLPVLASGSIAIHEKIAAQFLPTAVKFHYIFNLRDLAKIYEAILFTSNEALVTPDDLVKLYLHEAHRVYGDRMMTEIDCEMFTKLLNDTMFKEIRMDNTIYIFSEPLIYFHYAAGLGMPSYLPVKEIAPFQSFMNETLSSYNASNVPMNLALFTDAICHICRISRILESPSGNALLVGVGGSGKQSLARLAAFVGSMEFKNADCAPDKLPNFKALLNTVYRQAGVKSMNTVLMIPYCEEIDHKFLAIINDVLSGIDPIGVFTDEEINEITDKLKGEGRALGYDVDKDTLWRFFLRKVKIYLKLVITYSPVGSAMRKAARYFPALINCTTMNWFHKWPEEALVLVAERMIGENEDIQNELKLPICTYMASVHELVNKKAAEYTEITSKYYYTTPRTFISLIDLYLSSLKARQNSLYQRAEQFIAGLKKLGSIASQTEILQLELADKEKIVNARSAKATELVAIVTAEAKKVAEQKSLAEAENSKLEVKKNTVRKHQQLCAGEMEKVKPTLAKAAEALKTLTVDSLSALKSYNNPPLMVTKVLECVLVLLNFNAKDLSWKAARSVMLNVTDFMNKLENYDRDSIPVAVARRIKKILKDENLDPEAIKKKSSAASGLCAWVVNMIKYHDVFQGILPKKKALDQANSELDEATEQYNSMVRKIEALEQELDRKNGEVKEKVAQHNAALRDKATTVRAIDLANRLVVGTADSRTLWEKQVVDLKEQLTTLTGDMLLTSAFLTYMGYFSTTVRNSVFKTISDMLKNSEPPIPSKQTLSALEHLADDASRADWITHGLPDDDYSYENAVIFYNTTRIPLLIDPQQEGVRWIRNEFEQSIVTVKIDQSNLIEKIISAATIGSFLLIENVEEEIDNSLMQFLDASTWRKTGVLRFNKQSCQVHPDFRVALHTRIANPQFRPELQALLALIDFSVTPQSLESQLLSIVVESENPTLESDKQRTTLTLNTNKVLLKELEASLLKMLANAEGDFLQNTQLVDALETNVKTSKEIEVKTVEAKKLNEEIDHARGIFKPTAVRGTTIFSVYSDLHKIHPMYRYNLRAFRTIFKRGVEAVKDISSASSNRVSLILKSVTLQLFKYACRGLFEEHKLLLSFQIAISIARTNGQIRDEQTLDFLLRFDIGDERSPIESLSNKAWSAIRRLCTIPLFGRIDQDMVVHWKRWETLINSKFPETAVLPEVCSSLNQLERLCIIRALRPDRILYAIRRYVELELGADFVRASVAEMSDTYSESSNLIPVFFILSPGVDPVNELEQFASKLGFTSEKKNFWNVSLGQGQEALAESALSTASEKGHWIVLQNIHLVTSWLPTLEKMLEHNSYKSRISYRVFLTAEPAIDASMHVIPNGILEMSLKVTNEPPTGMSANLSKALNTFNDIDCINTPVSVDYLNQLVFGMCYFHAALTQRKKYGSIGWNKVYPFGANDLTICVNLLINHISHSNSDVPWTDLRYLIGEIMYGGHITDDWDRRMCKAYLEKFLNPSMTLENAQIYPALTLPPFNHQLGMREYHKLIDAKLSIESPVLYGLHPNAEIDFMKRAALKLFNETLRLQKADNLSAGELMQAVSREERMLAIVEEISGGLPENIQSEELQSRFDDPFDVVRLQECQRMNILLDEIRSSLKELEAGLKGELTMSLSMETVLDSMEMNVVPSSWESKAYPSLLPLSSWLSDLSDRHRELDVWTMSGMLPKVVWLGGLFNPQSFLTAIMQTVARANHWPLDKMSLTFDITKYNVNDILPPIKEGVYVQRVFLDGASWNKYDGVLDKAVPMQVAPMLPVIHIRTVLQEDREIKNVYECPMYKVKSRGPTFVWKFPLNTKKDPSLWTIAGVAMLLQD